MDRATLLSAAFGALSHDARSRLARRRRRQTERVTHAQEQRDAFDGYNRGLQWARTCAEVTKLQLARKPACYRFATAGQIDRLASALLDFIRRVDAGELSRASS